MTNQALTEARDAGLRAGTRYRLTGNVTDAADECYRIAMRHRLNVGQRSSARRAYDKACDQSSSPKYRDGSGVRGRKPYGHYADEESCLARLSELRDAEGLPFAEVAKALNAEWHRRRDGAEWDERSVSAIYRKSVARCEG